MASPQLHPSAGGSTVWPPACPGGAAAAPSCRRCGHRPARRVLRLLLLPAAGQRLLVVDSAAVQQELGSLPCPLGLELCDALGVVLEWVGRPGKVEFGLVERTAARSVGRKGWMVGG